MDDEDVYFGLARNGVRYGAQQPAGDRANAQIADDEQVCFDLFGQMQQRTSLVPRQSSDLRCRWAPAALARSRASWRIAYTEALPCILITQVPEAVGGLAVGHAIGGGAVVTSRLFPTCRDARSR